MMTFGAYVVFFLLTSVLPESAGFGPFTFGFPLLIAVPVGMAAAALLRRRDGTARVPQTPPARLQRRDDGDSLARRRHRRSRLRSDDLGHGGALLPQRVARPLRLAGDITIAPNHLFVGGASLLLAVALHLLLTQTKQGKAMRAASDNPDLARASGIDVNRTLLWTWAVAGSLAGAAGTLLVVFNATSQIKPSLGFQMLVPLFAAVIVGGIGNPYGAFAGALLIGVSMEASTAFVPPTYKPAVAFAVMVIVLLFRPRGLFGSRD